MEDKIRIFKALGNETRFKIFKNKIYIEPNIETMKEIAGYFDILVSDYEKGVLRLHPF